MGKVSRLKKKEGDGYRKHLARIDYLRDRRAQIAAIRADEDRSGCTLKTGLAFVHTERGLRHFVFPRLPDDLDTQAKINICKTWCQQQVDGTGMLIMADLFTDGPIFTAPTRAVNAQGFGDVVEEWGTLEFMARLQQSFIRAVNKVLEERGLPGRYSS